jgi:hypothetical protein
METTMKISTPVTDTHHRVSRSTAPRSPEPPRYDPRLIAAALNAVAAVVRWLDHHMGGWLM